MSKKHQKGSQYLAQPVNVVHSTTNEVNMNEIQVNEDQQKDQEMEAVQEQVAEGAEILESTTPDEHSTLSDEGANPAEPEEQSTTSEAPRTMQVAMGIGQFCRYLMLNSAKTNAEILALVLTHFPAARTTPACIAWYKTDLRKKGLLPATSGVKSGVKTINLSADELQQLTK